ncbi:discoidin domain-containing protein [Nocardioides zeae]|uniref:Discoidin domain-containing protein n=1 Tax=Nocardioides imazamoxiresistens TaxID=3231893 RepID=A0ABU3PZD6_9ACTN|nr:discoidin domain-containing protein [Nocardioides zeae]MDT9594484.1 discoidin domain-containing protein [Nocardioides zeae]
MPPLDAEADGVAVGHAGAEPATNPGTSTLDDLVPLPAYGSGPRYPLFADEVAPTGAYASTPAGGPPGLPPVPGAAAAAPRRRPSRRLPVLVVALALLLVGAVVGTSLLVLRDSEPRTDETRDGASEAPASSDAPAPDPREGPAEVEVDDPRPLRDLATVTASATGPAGRSLAGDEVTYEAANVLDGDPATAWRVEGDGTGQTLSVAFDEEVAVTSVGLVNGYDKVDTGGGETVDWYERNRVVTQVRWTFDDGEVLEQDLDRDRSLQTLDIPATLTRSVELEIVGVSGHSGADRTPISEVEVVGAPASEVTPSQE